MKRLTVAVASILLLAACTQSPTGPKPTFSEPYGTFTLNVGPNASAILNPVSGTDVPALVALYYNQQQAADYEQLAEESADFIVEDNPEYIEIIQTRILPVSTTSFARKAPSPAGCPEIAPMLREALEARGKFFTVGSPQTVENCFVMMAVDGSSDVEVQLLVTETRLTRPAGAIK